MSNFKIGDSVVITEVGEYAKRHMTVGEIGIVEESNMYGYKIFIEDRNTHYFTYNDKNDKAHVQLKLYEENPRFHAAQVGDLLWNDELGICTIYEITASGDYPLHISSVESDESDEITLDGKRFMDSPKATFFYYSEEDHYLTERPEPKIDWSTVEEGTDVVANSPNGSGFNKKFYAYLPGRAFPVLTKDNVNGLEEWRTAILKK